MGLNSYHLRTRWYMSNPTFRPKRDNADSYEDRPTCLMAMPGRASSRPGSGIKRSKDKKKTASHIEPEISGIEVKSFQVNRRVYNTFEFIFKPSKQGQIPWKDFSNVSRPQASAPMTIILLFASSFDIHAVVGDVFFRLFIEVRTRI